MSRATQSQNKLVEEFFEFMNMINSTEIVKANDGCNLHLINEDKFRKKFLKSLVIAYDLGANSIKSKEESDGFSIEDYLIRS